MSAVLEEEIEALVENLEEIQKSSGLKEHEVRNCSNFDKKACLLQRRLEKIGGLSDEEYVKESQDLAESSIPMSMSHEIDKGSCVSGPSSKIESADVILISLFLSQITCVLFFCMLFGLQEFPSFQIQHMNDLV